MSGTQRAAAAPRANQAQRTTPHAFDRLFRDAGRGALVALVATAAALLIGADTWRVPFVLAHVLALVAFVPLGTALVFGALRAGVAEQGSWLGGVRVMVARAPVVSALVVIAVVSVAVTLMQFDGGSRAVRAAANAVTLVAVGVLVVRYLRAPVGR